LKARDASEFHNFHWSGNELRFQFSNPDQAEDLSLLLPEIWSELTLQRIEKDGVPIEFTLTTIKGRRYALFSAGETGAFTILYQ
jgi:hypothetical protein